MNKIFPSICICIAFFFLIACNNQSKDTFSLSGTVTEKGIKKLYINHLTLTKTSPIDTIIVDSEGKYSCQIKADAPELYFIQTENSPQFIFFMAQNGDEISLNIEQILQSKNYTVTGNEHSKILKELDDESRANLKQLIDLNKQSAEIQTSENQDSTKILIENKINRIQKEYKKYLTDFIDKYAASSPAVIQALVQRLGREAVFNISIDRKLFEKADQALFPKFPGSSLVAELHERLASIIPPPEVGSPALNINLKTPQDNFFSLDSLRGKYVWLEFWASWCPDCRKENPALLSVFNKYKHKNFTIYQVSLDKNKEEWLQGIKADDLSVWHHVSDLKYWDCEPAKQYGVRFIPAGFLIDPEGKIIARFLSTKELDEKLHEIFNK